MVVVVVDVVEVVVVCIRGWLVEVVVVVVCIRGW